MSTLCLFPMTGRSPLTASSATCTSGPILSFQQTPESQDLEVQSHCSDTVALHLACPEGYQTSETAYTPRQARCPQDPRSRPLKSQLCLTSPRCHHQLALEPIAFECSPVRDLGDRRLGRTRRHRPSSLARYQAHHLHGGKHIMASEQHQRTGQCHRRVRRVERARAVQVSMCLTRSQCPSRDRLLSQAVPRQSTTMDMLRQRCIEKSSWVRREEQSRPFRSPRHQPLQSMTM
jgi:hypothetical protein